MPSAAGITKRVSSLLRKVGPPIRLVYLRDTTRINADSLTGYAGDVTLVDTKLDPQPYYARMGRDRIAGEHTKSQDASIADGSVRVLDDWVFYVSPDSLSLAQIQDSNFLLVLKDTSSSEEVFKLIDMEPAMAFGGDVLFTCYMRSTKRLGG